MTTGGQLVVFNTGSGSAQPDFATTLNTTIETDYTQNALQRMDADTNNILGHENTEVNSSMLRSCEGTVVVNKTCAHS